MNDTLTIQSASSADDDSSYEGLEANLNHLQFTTTLSNDCYPRKIPAPRHPTPSLELVVLPKDHKDIVVWTTLLLGTMKTSLNFFQFPNVIDLNIGGFHYTTSLVTLRKYEDSLLAAMFSGGYDLVRDKDGYIFLDHDGRYFG